MRLGNPPACRGHSCAGGRLPCRSPLRCSGAPADAEIVRFQSEHPPRPPRVEHQPEGPYIRRPPTRRALTRFAACVALAAAWAAFQVFNR